MKHVWVDTLHDPNYDKAVNNGVKGFFFDLFDPRVTRAYLQDVALRGYAVGVYFATNWHFFDDKDPKGIAELVAAKVKPIRVSNGFPKVQFDMEEHDPDRIAATLEEWRKILPQQDTSWTMEPMQGGWMTPAFVNRILACRVRVVPQAYFGGMQAVAQDTVLRDVIRRGFPENVVSLFYDARALPALWDGFAFTQNRLP